MELARMRFGQWYLGSVYIPTGLLYSVGQQQRWQNVTMMKLGTLMKADVPPHHLIPPRHQSLWCMWSVQSSLGSVIANVSETWTEICGKDHTLDLYGQHSWKYIHIVQAPCSIVGLCSYTFFQTPLTYFRIHDVNSKSCITFYLQITCNTQTYIILWQELQRTTTILVTLSKSKINWIYTLKERKQIQDRKTSIRFAC